MEKEKFTDLQSSPEGPDVKEGNCSEFTVPRCEGTEQIQKGDI